MSSGLPLARTAMGAPGVAVVMVIVPLKPSTITLLAGKLFCSVVAGSFAAIAAVAAADTAPAVKSPRIETRKTASPYLLGTNSVNYILVSG